jgi:hypothetical protein
VDGRDGKPAAARSKTGTGCKDFPQLTLEELLGRYENVQQLSDNTWMVSCPVPGHGKGTGDHNPSLHVSVGGEDGDKALFHCFAGCSQEAVIEHSGFTGGVPRITDAGQSTYTPPVKAARTGVEYDPEVWPQAYHTVLGHLRLTDEHGEHLRERGLTDDDIRRAGYKSLETLTPEGRQQLRAALTDGKPAVPKLGKQAVPGLGQKWAGVPGVDDLLRADRQPAGLLVPFRQGGPAGYLQGNILAMQVRLFGDGPRYKWFGAGVDAGAVTHGAITGEGGFGAGQTVRVTEGALKADVISALTLDKPDLRLKTVGVAGVNNWPAAWRLLKKWDTQTVRLAFDQDEPGRKAALAMMQKCEAIECTVEVEVWDGQYKGLDDALKAGAEVRVLTGKDAREALGTPAGVARRARRFLSMAELDAMPDPEWLVRDYLVAGGLAVLSGEPGLGKSFVAVDLAMSVASGLPFLGKHATKPGAVLYIAGEGGLGMKKRRAAWCKHLGREVPGNLFLCPEAFDFKDPNGTELEALLEAARAATPEGPALLIVDTLARNLHGSDNDPKDMGPFVRTCDLLRAYLGCAVLVIHHTGWMDKGRERGSSHLAGAADTRLLLHNKDALTGCCWLQCLKQKDAREAFPVQLEKTVVDLGLGWPGECEEDRQSLVLMPVDREGVARTPEEAKKLAQAAKRAEKAAEKDKKVLAALRANPGIPREPSPHWGGITLQKVTGLGKDALKASLDRLKKADPARVRQEDDPQRQQPTRYWLTEAGEAGW